MNFPNLSTGDIDVTVLKLVMCKDQNVSSSLAHQRSAHNLCSRDIFLDRTIPRAIYDMQVKCNKKDDNKITTSQMWREDGSAIAPKLLAHLIFVSAPPSAFRSDRNHSTSLIGAQRKSQRVMKSPPLYA
jgi:hypothetical protein